VTNVAAFGAFVDVGVHQDGLVHVSQLAERFVKDAREVVKAGSIVKVRVVEVDAARARIGLTMKLGVAPAPSAAPASTERARGMAPVSRRSEPSGAMAAAFAKLRR
jgi:uncharacterized protein